MNECLSFDRAESEKRSLFLLCCSLKCLLYDIELSELQHAILQFIAAAVHERYQDIFEVKQYNVFASSKKAQGTQLLIEKARD